MDVDCVRQLGALQNRFCVVSKTLQFSMHPTIQVWPVYEELRAMCTIEDNDALLVSELKGTLNHYLTPKFKITVAQKLGALLCPQTRQRLENVVSAERISEAKEQLLRFVCVVISR